MNVREAVLTVDETQASFLEQGNSYTFATIAAK